MKINLDEIEKLASDAYGGSLIPIEAYELISMIKVVRAARIYLNISSTSNAIGLTEALEPFGIESSDALKAVEVEASDD